MKVFTNEGIEIYYKNIVKRIKKSNSITDNWRTIPSSPKLGESMWGSEDKINVEGGRVFNIRLKLIYL